MACLRFVVNRLYMDRFSRSLFVGLGLLAGWMAFSGDGFSCSSAFGQAAGRNVNSVDGHLPAIRVSLDGEGSVLNRVVSTPSPTPVVSSPVSTPGVVFGAADSPVATPTPAPVQVVERPLPSGVSVPGSRVLSAVAGAPGSDAGGDFLDGALVVENGNSVGRPNGVVAVDNGAAYVGSSSPSPTASESVPSATPVPGGSVSASATPGSPANPEVAVPVPTLEPPNLPPEETGPVPTVPLPRGSPQPQGSPLPQGPPLPQGSPGAVPDTTPVQDKVYDLVAGRLPDRNSVRGPAQPRVGFFPRAPEPDTAQKLFMQASGGDLPTEEAGVW